MKQHIQTFSVATGGTNFKARERKSNINITCTIALILTILAPQAFAQEKTDTTEVEHYIGVIPDDAFVKSGEFTGAIKVPGTKGSFKIGGMVQVNANFDFDNQGFQQIGVPPSIPLDEDPEDEDQQFGIHTRLSQLNFDYRSPTKVGNLRIFIEFDMFGNGNTGEFTNDYTARLRHAGVELGDWRFGQYHSAFVDLFSMPEGADAESPLAAPVLRQPAIVYKRGGTHEGSHWGFGIENPAFEYSGSDEQYRSEAMPNFIGFGRLERSWGYVRLAGLFMQLRSAAEEVYTGGFNFSGRINLPLWHDKDNFSFATQFGVGFVHYYSSFVDVGGLDGHIADNGDIEATGIFGAFVTYQHWWSDRVRSTFMASVFELDSPELVNGLLYSGGERYTVNLFWSPVDVAAFGLEYNYQTLETADGTEGKGTRLDFVGRFFF